jgi:septation ring formation regulator EzrA
MEFEFSPAEEPKKATEKHVNELNAKIDKLTNQVDGLEQKLSKALQILDKIAYDVRMIDRRVHM